MNSEESKISDTSKITLGEWQKLAVSHFTALSSWKKEKNIPVFSLEHPFSPFQLECIFLSLIKDYSRTGVNRFYWLLWVIYATEIGYSYTGEEYWHSFEEKIVGWHPQHREDIRWSFKEFRKRFYAMEPAGPWANHFSIISLPITNAILPRDLQTHFANLLYLCRYQLRTISLNNPETVGKLLSANSFVINSSRFQNFLQQEELVGRLALSLLDENLADSKFELISSQTLKRIISDLEQRRNAKEWVQETRREIKPRILGMSGGTTRMEARDTNDDVPKKTYNVKPKLKLYRSGIDKWTIIVEIPKLINISRNPILIKVLTKARFQISGVKGKWIPAESLLYNSLKKRLDKWPEDDSLVKFEQQDAVLQDSLKGHLTITKGPWLFSISNDGTATEIEGKFLRPNRKYIVIYQSETAIPTELTEDAEVLCEGVIAKRIEVPSTVSEEQETLYRKFGFEVFKTLRIWPAGLSARAWDGEGVSEWLTTESPCFGIVYDYDIDELLVRMGSETHILKTKLPGEVRFIKFDPLPVGQHILSIRPKSKKVSPSEGLLCLDVREPVSWTPGTALHNGLTAFLDPNDDNLDSFFRGKTNLKIYGPQSHSITIHIDLFLGNLAIDSFISQPMVLPFTDEKLNTIRNQVGRNGSFGIAQTARLKIVCEDVGYREFILSRDLKPFRWIHRMKNSTPFLRLIDETDSGENPELFFYDLLRPDEKTCVSSENFLGEFDAGGFNGLFWAKKAEYEHGIILLSDVNPRKNDLSFLSISPKLKIGTYFTAFEHLKLIHIWYSAQCTSFLAQIHLEKIIEMLVSRLFEHLCGPAWAREELDFIANFDFAVGFEKLAGQVKNRSMANVIRFRLMNKNKDDINFNEELDWYLGAAARCDLTDKPRLLIDAVQFSSDPLSFLSNPEELKSLVDRLFANPDLLRASRLFTLGISKLRSPFKNFALLSPGGIR